MRSALSKRDKRCGKIRLRDFRTLDGERLLADIARQNDLARNTLKHIKNLLSGIFKHAKRLGCISGVNPMQDVSIPKSRPAGPTYAYSLEEITKMISILPQPAATVVATAAFTGMRKGEIRGFLRENYHDDAIWVTQSVWERFVTEPKTQQSVSAIPVIRPLAQLLQKQREATGNPQAGFVFQSRNYRHKAVPLAPNPLLKWHIKPKLLEANIVWRGWHAFRRGLATNLYRLGVPDKTIQAILRHSVSVWRRPCGQGRVLCPQGLAMDTSTEGLGVDLVGEMKTKDAAKYIGVSEWKLRELMHQGKLAYISDGEATSAFRFRVQALENYLSRHEVPARE